MQKYLWDTYHINFAFDTLVGSNYYDMCDVTTLEYDKKITLTGSKYAVDNILHKLDEVGTKYRILDITNKEGSCMKSEYVVDETKYVSSSMNILTGLLMNDDPYYEDDESKYTVTIEKLD